MRRYSMLVSTRTVRVSLSEQKKDFASTVHFHIRTYLIEVNNDIVQYSRNFQQKFIDLFFSVNQFLYKELNTDWVDENGKVTNAI